MQKSDLSAEQYEQLMRAIFAILAEKGPSQTTMDLVARRLVMSKRTLYEIFDSKDDMLRSVMEFLQKRTSARILEIIQDSANVIEAMANILLYHQSMMHRICVDFFVDMDQRYRHLRGDYETSSRKWNESLEQALSLGISQGVVRDDLDIPVFVSLMRVQMESLKRMEEFFPPNITLLQAYNTICLSMLRTMATPRGLEIVETLTPKFRDPASGMTTTNPN